MVIRTLLAIGVVLAAGEASAQQPQAVPAGLNVGELPRAVVLDDRGVETPGRLLTIDDKSVVLLVDGVRRDYELRHVQRVTRRGDSLKNGAIIGAVVGLAMGAITAGFGDCIGDCRGGQRAAALIMGPIVYAAIGTGIDAAIQGRTTLYKRPAVEVSAHPTAGASVALRVRW